MKEGNPPHMRENGYNCPDESGEDEKNIKRSEEIILQTELNGGEREVENKVENKRKNDNKRDFFSPCHQKYFSVRYNDQQI